MSDSSRDKAEGKGSQAKGVMKEKTGKAVKDDKMAREGTKEKAKGYAKEKKGEMKDNQ
ncbi:MAG: CsbD family protein [Alkalicoccus sp.]|nr:MAG: CsbD family protein [Alkalicoccus sp.]